MLRMPLITGAALALLAAACGSSAIPTAKLANSKSTISAAEEAGARNVPQAALHLKLAQDQLEAADRLGRQGDGERAELYASQSQADADMALALAHQDAEKKSADQAQNRVHDLAARAR